MGTPIPDLNDFKDACGDDIDDNGYHHDHHLYLISICICLCSLTHSETTCQYIPKTGMLRLNLCVQ